MVVRAYDNIIQQLPYTDPFLFVDGLKDVSDEGVTGYYTFKKNEYFYRGHFKNNPVTPGVILTECMAQIGVVCLGIYLIDGLSEKDKIALTENQIQFLKPVLPGEKMIVISKKEYFRFGKLKCLVKMVNEKKEVVCKGSISGVLFKLKE
ncbi:MAG: hydroxymyristoyl-ACP dehydratase [Bacteroidetes bacterium]|nr:hydroxymyristoyl-ACP dehydratase [Bacteroidota bacterium]